MVDLASGVVEHKNFESQKLEMSKIGDIENTKIDGGKCFRNLASLDELLYAGKTH